MFLVKLLRQASVIYAVLLMLDFIVPFATSTIPSWMDWVHKICMPGEKLGSTVAGALFPEKLFKVDIAPLVGVLLCWVIKWVLGWFL